MKLLLDTHALLWWINDPALLSMKAADAIAAADNDVMVSPINAFEIATKNRIGKLPGVEELVLGFAQEMTEQGFVMCGLSLDQALLGGSMPIPHRDPFDRLLIAQAQIEQAWLVSNEALFDQFGVRRLW